MGDAQVVGGLGDGVGWNFATILQVGLEEGLGA